MNTPIHDELAARYTAASDRLWSRPPRRVIREHPAPPEPERDWLLIPASQPASAYDDALEDPSLPPWKRICIEVAAKHNISYRELISERQHKNLAYARFEAMYRMQRELEMSFPAIGRRLHRHYSTVIHGVKRWEEMNGGGLHKIVQTIPCLPPQSA